MILAQRLRKSSEVWLFLGLLAAFAYFPPRWAEWNQNSRMDLTRAIVEQGRFEIDDYYQNTGDYAVYNGHVYTDKAPGTSLLAVPSYAVYRAITQIPFVSNAISRLSQSQALAETLRDDGSGLLADKIYFAGALYFSTFFSVSIPSALAGVALYRFLALFVANRRVRLLATLGYALGTVVFPYSTVFYGQQIAAALILFAWERLHRVRTGAAPPSALVVAGALLGMAVLTEFTSALPAGFLVIYTFTGLKRKADIARLAIGGLPFAALLGFYNAACFGSPFTSSYRYLGRFPEIVNYGFMGFGLPRLEALWGITFSPFRGLFFYSPFLLLALPGWWLWRRDGAHRAEWGLSLAAVAMHLILISGWYDWQGGFAIGPRNLLLVLPFMMIPTAVALEAAWSHRAWRWAASGLIGLSVIVVGIASVSGQDFPPITITNPLFEYFLPKFQSGDIARNLGMFAGLPAHWSLLPIVILIGGLSLWMFAFRGEPRRSPQRA